ncbi:helix-turn-helix domain-containing protein [Aeromicrobium sp. HA]|uniref:helix-turn-helix domain-containing protein n=1 Tax=Aeromicrobium sp. HA TaxID=3009077 RepID=UPI0022B06DC2|nr:helix-turn-helix domain-containing protein [Aeromicrobium sp. HA]
MPAKRSVKNEALLTNREVAERLNVSLSTVKRMRYAGELPTIEVRGTRRVPLSAIESILRGE